MHRLTVNFLCAVAGLALFAFVGSSLGWIDPVWWGGEALFVPAFGVLSISVISPASFLALQHFIRRRGTEPNLWRFAVSGFVIGTFGFPLSLFTLSLVHQSFVPPVALFALVLGVSVFVVVFVFSGGSRGHQSPAAS